MNRLRDVFVDQIALCHQDRGWFPTLKEVLQGLTVEQAVWKPGNHHSIAELVNHLTYWNEIWLERFQGGTPVVHESNDQSFSSEAALVDEEQWQAAVAKLNQVMDAWSSSLRQCPEIKMNEALPGEAADSTWWEVLSVLTTHNVYHLGQMVYIRKQQGI
ncbi:MULTISPECIES: DinB family protein [Paenibacillus]|uniref:DinB family protein n=1 Tax=Paenibacillus TaxID=44249 RepID=UPI0022B91224|nr:DinB family protein [Paenibacillus caseinilyticus]MCZ8522426.1 DinB family protein [Paenibacillus caseinilyticus]